MTYRRPPDHHAAARALAVTMGRLRAEELSSPLAGRKTTTEVYAGAVVADNVAQQVISTPWRARTGGLWHDVLATIVEADGRLLVGLQATIIANGDEGFSGGMAFQGGDQAPGDGSWSTVDVMCYVGATLVATVPLTSSTTTKRHLLSVPIPENAAISYRIQVDSGTTITEPSAGGGLSVARWSLDGIALSTDDTFAQVAVDEEDHDVDGIGSLASDTVTVTKGSAGAMRITAWVPFGAESEGSIVLPSTGDAGFGLGLDLDGSVEHFEREEWHSSAAASAVALGMDSHVVYPDALLDTGWLDVGGEFSGFGSTIDVELYAYSEDVTYIARTGGGWLCVELA